MLKDIIDCPPRPRIEVHRFVHDLDHCLRKLREHLFKSLLLPAFYALQVLTGIFVRKETRLLRSRLAQS